jgi:hypothetical protein
MRPDAKRRDVAGKVGEQRKSRSCTLADHDACVNRFRRRADEIRASHFTRRIIECAVVAHPASPSRAGRREHGRTRLAHSVPVGIRRSVSGSA